MLALATGLFLGIASAADTLPPEVPPPPMATAKAGSSKAGKKKGKKGKKKKGGKKKDRASLSPWGNHKVLVSGHAGLAWLMVREAPEEPPEEALLGAGEEAEDPDGTTMESCNGDDCTSVNSNTNGATGWGPGFGGAIWFAGIGGSPNTAIGVRGSRHNITLNGNEHYRIDETATGGLTTPYLLDVGTYEVALNQVQLAAMFATRFTPKGKVFGMGRFGIGYAWADVETTVKNDDGIQRSGSFGGPTIGFETGLGIVISKSMQVTFVTPIISPIFALTRVRDGNAFPFLPDGDDDTSGVTMPLQVEATLSF